MQKPTNSACDKILKEGIEEAIIPPAHKTLHLC